MMIIMVAVGLVILNISVAFIHFNDFFLVTWAFEEVFVVFVAPPISPVPMSDIKIRVSQRALHI